MKDITIKKLPGLSTAQNYARIRAAGLPDNELITAYAKIAVLNNAAGRNRLPSSYYKSVASAYASGRVPKDMWLTANLRTTKEEFWQEIVSRGLENSFTIWDETRVAANA